MKNFTRRVLGILLVCCLLLTSSVLPAVARAEESASNGGDVLFSISKNDIGNIKSRDGSHNSFFTTDFEGNIYGPQDFAYDEEENAVYLLDTATESIVKFEDGEQTDVFSYMGRNISVKKIAAADEKLFLLDIRNNKIHIQETDTLVSREIPFDASCVIDFKTINGDIYLTLALGEHGTTFLLDEADLSIRESFDGRAFDEKTTYRTELIAEGDRDIGHSCIVTIYDSSLQEEIEITLRSDYWLAGAQLVGYDEDTYNIKVYEFSDNVIEYVQETVITVDKNGNKLGVTELNEKFNPIANDIKVINGEMYVLNNSTSMVELRAIEPARNNALEFESKLDQLVTDAPVNLENNTTPQVPYAISATISRDTILSNAKLYYTSFSWTCTADNLKSGNSNWTKPSYITGAGTYTKMPYCWGGNDTPSRFKTNLTNGYWAGNVNCPSTGYVSKTAGVDCSGYVGNCWGETTKYSTSTLSQISTEITYSSLQKGDAINKSGSHVVLYEKADGYGSYILWESTTDTGYVTNTTRTVTQLEKDKYVAIKYKYVQ